jgi:hypothetical protein
MYSLTARKSTGTGIVGSSYMVKSSPSKPKTLAKKNSEKKSESAKLLQKVTPSNFKISK